MKTDTNHKQLQQEGRGDLYFDNLARITSTLLAALLALFTFFVVTAAQSGITGFSTPLYTAVGLLGTSLVLYAVGYGMREYCYAAKQNRVKATLAKVLKPTRILQQVVFIASIGAVVWFAISYAQLFLNPKPIQQPAASQQGAPSSQAGPAPGETAEQHAEEMKKSQQ